MDRQTIGKYCGSSTRNGPTRPDAPAKRALPADGHDMRSREVPQDDSRMHPGERKLAYAVDENGNYVTVPYSGWDVEELVTSQAIEEFQRAARDAYERSARGETAPLEYHMYARRMDVQVLAQSTGVLKMTVRRHLRRSTFEKLKPAKLRRYADVLGLTIDELQRLPDRATLDDLAPGEENR
jgi:hypothetical protein